MTQTLKQVLCFLEDILSNIPKDILLNIPFQFESGSDFSKKEILTSPILTYDQENNMYHTRLYENEQNGNRAIQMKATCSTGVQLLTDIQDRIANLKIAGRTLDLDLEPGDVAIINNGIGSGTSLVLCILSRNYQNQPLVTTSVPKTITPNTS